MGHVAHVDEDKFVRSFGVKARMKIPRRQCRREGRGRKRSWYKLPGDDFPEGGKGPGARLCCSVLPSSVHCRR